MCIVKTIEIVTNMIDQVKLQSLIYIRNVIVTCESVLKDE